MSYSNSNVTKIQKKARFSHDEAAERTSKGRKLNKVSRNNKRYLWSEDQE